ncbi:MAG: HRDC domain-containing protein [Chloroflexi bacterium]|nr:HRDC domain-containing protein [Chloroflexota bacterium]
MITDADALAGLVERLSLEHCVVIDTESNSFHRFPDRVCLVQIAAGKRAWVVDPLEMTEDDVAPLGELMANPNVEKVIHAASNDIRVLDKEWSFRVANIFDTSIAAQFCGMRRVGLDSVLLDALGVSIVKSKSLQRADWTVRPLPDEALQYAVDDVLHLQDLRDELVRRLEELGRMEWVEEEFQRLENIRYRAPDPPEIAFLNAKGSRALGPQELAVLRELYVFRYNEGMRRDVPPFKIMSDAVLTTIAAAGRDDLDEIEGIPVSSLRRYGRRLQRARERGLAAEPVTRPRNGNSNSNGLEGRPTREQIDQLRDLKAWRNEQGEELDLDPALIWPMQSLERLARDASLLNDETREGASVVREWQAREFGESLAAALG